MKRIISIGFISIVCMTAFAQQRMDMDEAIAVARTQSVAALQAKSQFVSSYWAWRSYLASRLPSLNLYGNVGNFNRSLVQLQNYETGELVYASNNYLQNSVGLALNQNITATGGTVSLYSDLSRVDQFGVNPGKLWYAQPLSVTYSQPIFAFNSFKWDKIIAPKEYELAKRNYLEAMEGLTMSVVESYYDLLLAHRNREMAIQNYENTEAMRRVAAERMKIGSVTRDEYLQMELRTLNDSLSISESEVSVAEARLVLNSVLGLDDGVEIEPVADSELPDLFLDWNMVYDKSFENSSFSLNNEIKTLDAESAIARAKANRGISMALNARFGLTNSNNALNDTYRNLLDQEVVGISFTIPIFDWGLGRGRVKEAQAKAEVVKAQVAQSESDYRKSVFTAVSRFNNQRGQCVISHRAAEISRERYLLMMDRFRAGTASVTELNTARSEKDEAEIRYVNDLGSWWKYYYALRQLTLYDFIENHDIDVDYEELVN